jgi:hypothetical protein
MRFAVLNPRGSEVRDPDTDEVIGSVELEKVVVKIVRVEPRIAVGRTFRTFSSGLFMLSIGGARQETLRTDQATSRDELDPKDSYVNVGDPVVQVVGDEFGSD